MKTVLLSFVLFFSLNSFAFSQKQNLRLVDDIGQVLADDDYLKPARVIHIIFLKLEKKYPLVKRNKQVDDTLIKLIELRRQYRAYGDTKELVYRAYDHAIAQALTSGDSGVQANSQGCEEAQRALIKAMGRYDRALKNYSKCMSRSSFSSSFEIPIIDNLFGNANNGNTSNASASGSGCKSQLSELRKASSWLTRMINNRNWVCKFG